MATHFLMQDRPQIARIASIAALAALSAACATAREPRELTMGALEQAAAACGVPDARLATDHHVSIVLRDSPDRREQTGCLSDRLRGMGYWWDQIVIERAAVAPS